MFALSPLFGGDERNFLGPLMRFAHRDVRDRIAYQKDDHGGSYRPRGGFAAVERSRNHLSRDFRGRSIFDF